MDMTDNNAFSRLEKEYKKYAEYCTYAVKEVSTKLDNLKSEMKSEIKTARSDDSYYNLIDSYHSRIKTFDSTFEKLVRRKMPPNMESIKDFHDIAGVRVITPFKDDVYKVAEMLSFHRSITVVETKDYIEDTKENGYKSLHLITNVNYSLGNIEHNIPTEIQIRSMAMDMLWSLDHIINYKKAEVNPKNVELFQRIAKILDEFEDAAMELRDTAGVQAATELMKGAEAIVAGAKKAAEANQQD